MTQAVDPNQVRRASWVARVTALAEQIMAWCQSRGWPVQEDRKTIYEDDLGAYSVPELRITAPGGTVHFNPVALNVLDADGRVDLTAFPTLSRVKLLGSNGEWQVMTDSN